MITITHSSGKKKQAVNKTVNDLGVGLLFSASPSDVPQAARHVYLRTFSNVVKLADPQFTYTGSTTFYDIEELDGALTVWPK